MDLFEVPSFDSAKPYLEGLMKINQEPKYCTQNIGVVVQSVLGIHLRVLFLGVVTKTQAKE